MKWLLHALPLLAAACAPLTATHGGLDARAARLTADVAWLADDAREGRRAGTAGEQASARWLAERMADLGLEPAGEDGSFLQGFPVPLPSADGGGSWLAVSGAGGSLDTERTRTGLAPLFCSAGGAAEGTPVFYGYGIEDADLGWLDFGERPLPERAIAVVLRGTPRAAEPPERAAGESHGDHGAAETSTGWGHGGSIFTKVMNAKRRGAKAVLVAQHPDDEGEALLAFDPSRGARAGIPALFVDARLAARLVPDFAERVRAADRVACSSSAAAPTADLWVSLESDVRRETGTAHNVLGVLPGGDGPAVIVGAHFDHLGRGGTGSLAPDGLGRIHNGADDNASGTAVVVELARTLAERPTPPAGDVIFALWSGEELGLLGSEHWCALPTVPLDTIAANLNLDMVGRADDGALTILGAGTSPAFAGWMDGAGAAAGLDLSVSLSGQGIGGSDHQSFLRRQIPALHLFSGLHADYHRPSDDTEAFEARGAARVCELALELIGRMQGEEELAYVEPAREAGEADQRRSRGFRVRFGTVPDYAFDGPGVRLAGTSAGSPAEKAGMIAGDVLVGLGDMEIETMYDFVYFLQVHKPGDVVRAEFLRDGETERALVTLESREVE
ncbi:MAG: M28 family peptidase [Planctomycetota bacterium]|nr:M28 family peptidase [Planctomycetota bacterium]